VGYILQRQEFSDAVQQDRREEYGEIFAEEVAYRRRFAVFSQKAPAAKPPAVQSLLFVFLGLLGFFLLVHAFGH
jgi:hypothetical protein